jgi:LysM repeat protein
MSQKESPREVIEAYRKRQERAQRTPKIILFIAAIVLIGGAAALIFWITSDEKPSISISGLFASETPTPTLTRTPTPVPPTTTPTLTPTDVPPTITPTPTLTPTRSETIEYSVQEGDNLTLIAQEFGVDLLVLIEYNKEPPLSLDPANPVIQVGDVLIIPPPGTELPTPTPLPDDVPAGTRIEYIVQSGDVMALIAAEFNSTVEDILRQNDLENANEIYVGQKLIIRVNLVTPEPTEEPVEDATQEPEG